MYRREEAVTSIKRKRSFLDIIDDYFENLEEEFERWRETLVDRPFWDQRNCTIEPLRIMKVTPTEVIMTVDLPLTEEKTVKVKTIDKRTIEISAEMKRKMRIEELDLKHYKGEFYGLHCHSRVPVPVQMDKITTHFKKGILEIRLPRKRDY